MYKDLEVINFFERDKVKKQYKIIISALIIILLTAIFPTLFILFFKSNVSEPKILIMGIFHFLIIWISSNLLATVIGLTVALIIKNEFSIIISLIIYGLLLRFSYINLPNRPINQFLNIFDDYTFIATNDIAGILFNTHYFIDKLFVFILIVVALLFGNIILEKRKRFYLITIECILIVALVGVTFYVNKNYQVFHYDYTYLSNNDYDIISYDMDLELNNELKNYAEITLAFKDKKDEIKLSLDSIFNVQEVNVNGNNVEFDHRGNILYINSSHNENESITIGINYEGKVNYQNDIGFDTFYVSKYAINLPGEVFYWYPTLSDLGGNVKFNINVNSYSTIYSNLSTTMISKNHYSLYGSSSAVNLFAGQYQVIEKEGIEYILPSSYKIESFESTLNSVIENEMLNSSQISLNSAKELNVLKNKNFNRVIVGIWPFTSEDDLLYIYEDTLLLRYIE